MILLQNWVPWCTYHVVLYCGTYYVKVSCYSCYESMIPFFSGHGPFLVVVPSGDAVLVVLPASLSLTSTCRIDTTACFPFLLQLGPLLQHRVPRCNSIFLELLHVCLRWNEVRFCFTTVLWCKRCWSVVMTNAWISCPCCMCFVRMFSRAKMMLYSLVTLDWHALIGLVH
jgi:hypothetical protein